MHDLEGPDLSGLRRALKMFVLFMRFNNVPYFLNNFHNIARCGGERRGKMGKMMCLQEMLVFMCIGFNQMDKMILKT